MLRHWKSKLTTIADQTQTGSQTFAPTAALVILLAVALWPGLVLAAASTASTRIWDTSVPFGDKGDILSRTGWKLVPRDLFSREANPAAAASDPGYYGREYSFAGDAAVENQHYVVVFDAARGAVVVYTKAGSGKKALELFPRDAPTGAWRIGAFRILQNTGNEAALELAFSVEGEAQELSAVVSFDKTEIIGVQPGRNMKGIRVVSAIEYGVVPDFISDDLVYSPGQYPEVDSLNIPSENLFLGLLEGRDRVLVSTWPDSKQQMKLGLGKGQAGRRLIETVDFTTDGRSVCLAVLSATGIWHREVLQPTYLEKDVAIGWKRPFPAKWTTQLYEAGVRTTFTFRESKDSIWRGVTGHYTYPTWFDGDGADFRLSKKIPPKGEAVIYSVEGRDTPASITTPVDVLKATLGRQTCEAILDFPGRSMRTHHRRGSVGIRRACTCGCTEAIEAVFKAGQEVDRKEYVTGAVDDMVYFVTRHVERIDEYREFADEMVKFLDTARRSEPSLKSYLDDVQAIVQEIPQTYSRHKENMKTLAYADELAGKTKALTAEKAGGNLPACLELGKQWRAMGGAQDNVIALYHSLTRKLAQEAGYRCVGQPEAVEVAREIRRRCRQCLRNADGYEIWPDY